MSLPLLLLVVSLGAEPIDPEKAAQIEHAQDKAQAEVNARYGNRKFTELSPEEREQRAKESAAADAKVLDENGVDAKQWAREALKRDRAAYADGKQRVKALQEKDKADAEAAAKAKQAPGEIQVQRGFSDENPVTLEEKESDGETPAVESGLPPEVSADQAAAAEQDRLEGTGPASDEEKPAAKAKGGGRRHR